MSVWTHVAAVIRLDDYRAIAGDKEDLSKYFIRDTWDNPNEKGNLPRGSEGSLDVEFIEKDDDSITRNVCIFGDLRDVDQLGDISRWWIGIAKGLPEWLDIRQAVLQAECENGKSLILTEKDMRIEK